ncbi:hypothetical protein ARMSODRAFT_1015154 [Armillaria solidipes]|uniref:Uncharacterized protein n=1 Tax=Armillaria solidipes TaxID=1076256 RepID=A0A2H3BX95_9AGAR|nr:hypothetical protein ARMSODRAFT_1015154 [Armillaria solidipes]
MNRNPVAVISVIRQIFLIIKIVHSMQDLKVGNATSVITIKDLSTVVKGENASFFTAIAFADIETIDHRFRNVWLPTILDFGKPGQHPTISAIPRADSTMDLRVFKTYVDSLEVDKLTAGFFAIIHSYGLLFHMHAVYAELHRIQISALTLAHPDLRYDIRLILQYLWDAADSIGWFSSNPAAVKARHLPLISAVISRLVPLPQGNSFLVYYYRDNYNALSSTEEGHQLTVAQPPKFGESRKCTRSTCRECGDDLNYAMRARGREQGITDGPGGFLGGRRPLPKHPPVRPPVPRLKMAVAGDVPVCEGNQEEAGDDLDGFVATIPETFFDLSQADDDPFAITPPTIEDLIESFKED